MSYVVIPVSASADPPGRKSRNPENRKTGFSPELGLLTGKGRFDSKDCWNDKANSFLPPVTEGLPDAKQTVIRKVLKEKFIHDLTPSEKMLFLNRAREAIVQKRYPANEDLFHYCYFLTLRERLRDVKSAGGTGYMRFLLVEGTRDTEAAVRLYQERLEKKKLRNPDPERDKFLAYFSE